MSSGRARASRLRAFLVATMAAAGLFALFPGAGSPAPGAGAQAKQKPNRYIGAAKCKSCHQAKESGDPYGTWASKEHARAFEVLASAESLEIAAKRGIPEPQESGECLRCHSTAFGKPEEVLARGFEDDLGVQCEACHGPGEVHMKARFAAASRQQGAAPEYTRIPADEIVIDPPLETCLGCHNPLSPSYRSFCFHEYRARVRHLDPKKPRTEEERRALAGCPCGAPCPHVQGCPDRQCNLTPDELRALRAEASGG